MRGMPDVSVGPPEGVVGSSVKHADKKEAVHLMTLKGLTPSPQSSVDYSKRSLQLYLNTVTSLRH